MLLGSNCVEVSGEIRALIRLAEQAVVDSGASSTWAPSPGLYQTFMHDPGVLFVHSVHLYDEEGKG